MPLRIVIVQSRRLPMPTAKPPQAIGPRKYVLDWASNTVGSLKYGNTGGKLPHKYGNFRKRSVETEIIFAFSFG